MPTHTTTRTTGLEQRLQLAKAQAMINDFKPRKPRGWVVTANEETFELATPGEAASFLDGLEFARRRRRSGSGTETSVIREEIRRHGRVEVALRNPEDAAERRYLRNTVFAQAYALGLKGKFVVHSTPDGVVGELAKSGRKPKALTAAKKKAPRTKPTARERAAKSGKRAA